MGGPLPTLVEPFHTAVQNCYLVIIIHSGERCLLSEICKSSCWCHCFYFIYLFFFLFSIVIYTSSFRKFHLYKDWVIVPVCDIRYANSVQVARFFFFVVYICISQGLFSHFLYMSMSKVTLSRIMIFQKRLPKRKQNWIIQLLYPSLTPHTRPKICPYERT